MDLDGTRRYELLAEILIRAMAADSDALIKALAAGQNWGYRLASRGIETVSPESVPSSQEAIDYLVDVLDAQGFSPEYRMVHGEQQIGLRHCPFLGLAEDDINLICQAHLGLTQGVLKARGARFTAERIDTFIEPDLCLLHLKPTQSERNGAGPPGQECAASPI